MTCKTPQIVSTPELGGCTKKSRILTGIGGNCHHYRLRTADLAGKALFLL
jgi:hypothetical protein